MASGWVLVILAVLTGQPEAVPVFVLAIMVPVAIWWRFMERGRRSEPTSRIWSILRAFVTPVQAAFAEWRASR